MDFGFFFVVGWFIFIIDFNLGYKGTNLSFNFQGCAVGVFCYPPKKKVVRISKVKGAPSPRPAGERPGGRGEGEAASDLPFSALWA
ncbi:hypothetical protein ACVGWS_06625, partial [Enterobacter hormaechei]